MLLRSLVVVAILLNAGAMAVAVGVLASSNNEPARFTLAPRTELKAFPVPSFRPSEPGKVIGVDAFPSAGAVPHPDNGYSWFDACDADIQHANGDVAVTCARMGIKSDRVEFGSRNFDGGTPKDVYIIRDRQVVGVFDDSGLTVFGTIRAQDFVKPLDSADAQPSIAAESSAKL